MKLKIDSRENSELTKQVLEKASELNIQTEKEWLDIGDYVFNDVCFEAKSSFDFLQSIVNNRLWNQMDNMDRAFDNNIVILYGTIEEAIQTHLSHSKSTMPKATQSVLLTKKFYGALGKIILDTDCTLLWVKNEKVAAQLICVVCKMQPHDREVYTPRMVKKRKISTTDLRIDVLTTIKGVSEKKAKALIDTFGSIMEIGEASSNELCALDGIGGVLAKRIHDTLNSEEKMEI